MADVQRTRHRGRRRVDGVDPLRAVRSKRYMPSASHRADHFASRPSRVGRSGTSRPGCSARRRSRHVRVTVPGCCGSTTPQPARCGRSSCASPGRLSMYVCGPTVYDYPTSATGASPWSSTSSGASSLRRPRRALRLEHHRHRRQHHRPGRPAPPAPRRRWPEYEAAWWEAMDGLGVARPTDDPHATGTWLTWWSSSPTS